MIFDKSIYKLDNSNYIVKGSGNNETQVMVKQSDHHIIVEPSNTNFDRYVIQEIVKEYAKKYPLCVFEKNRNFKMVQINNLDNMSYYAQTSLRRTMEKYSKTCRFISWCYSLSKVIEPLRSRCLCIHVPNIERERLVEWMYRISINEGIEYNIKVMEKIIEKSNNNMKEILWKMELYKKMGRTENEYYRMISMLIKEIVKSINDEISMKIIEENKEMIYNYKRRLTIKEIMSMERIPENIRERIREKIERYDDKRGVIERNIINYIKNGSNGMAMISNGNIQTKREYIYKILITNISHNTIIKEIMNNILIKYNKIEKEKILKIVELANKYDYRLSKCRRERIHIEAFIENVINIIINE